MTMNNYEVRVKCTHIDYYRLEANAEEHASAKIRHALSTRIMDNIKLDDSINRQHVIEYAVQLTPEGEPIL